jgi:CRP-like cAMP-binding protein
VGIKIPLDELARVESMLQTIPFMKSITRAEIQELAYQLTRRTFKKDETIIKQGEPGTLFYLISKGKVRVIKEKFFKKIVLAELNPGSFFGEMALIDDFPRTATVVGEEAGEMYTLSHEAFESILLKNPQVRELIMNEAEERKKKNQALEA